MKIKIGYWDLVGNEKIYSQLIRTETLVGSKEDIFKEFYKRNNSLRYCNGSYWKFISEIVQKEYKEIFYPKYNTASHYYGNFVD